MYFALSPFFENLLNSSIQELVWASCKFLTSISDSCSSELQSSPFYLSCLTVPYNLIERALESYLSRILWHIIALFGHLSFLFLLLQILFRWGKTTNCGWILKCSKYSVCASDMWQKKSSSLFQKNSYCLLFFLLFLFRIQSFTLWYIYSYIIGLILFYIF